MSTKNSGGKGVARRRIPAQLNYGQLPVEGINKALGLELTAGEVVMSGRAQLHAADRHPDDYSIVQPALAQIISRPLYVGDDFKNPGKIELVGRVSNVSGHVLVAIQIEKDASDFYNVVSCYRISDEKVTSRRLKKRLHNC